MSKSLLKASKQIDRPIPQDHKKYAAEAFEKIKESGLKMTKPREYVMQFLLATDKAFSPYEIRDELKKQHIKADVVTIYRVLEVLEQLGLVHKVLALNAYIRCNLKGPKSNMKLCHHYLLCRNCHRFEEFEGKDFVNLQKAIAAYYKKFHIESHYLEFMGLCRDCQKKGVVLEEHDGCLTHEH